jgi:hypothetical protein
VKGLAGWIAAAVILAAAAIGSARTAAAQDTWVQIEAMPSLAEAEARARAYSGAFPNVSGFRLTTGWYGIMLGPYTPEEADRQIALLKRERLIPTDSYIPESSQFRQRFWPVGAAALRPVPADPATDPAAGTEPAPDTATGTLPSVLPEPDETPRQARASEADLTREERELIQTALQWEGHYQGRIDGAFGPGTRNAMAAWQAASGVEETGILTTRQRADLITAYRSEQAALGLETVREQESGIEVVLPTAIIAFDHYEPPFVHYAATDGSGFRVLLISQQGDEDTLFGLYDIMQTLEIVPLDGERERRKSSFTLTGRNGTVASYTDVRLEGGLIKGFTLVWDPKDDDKAARILDAMKASFKPFGDRALDDSIGQPLAEDKAGLLAGLEVRRPRLSRSGFYVDATGGVLTTSEAVEGCGRITLDGRIDVDVAAEDTASGIALLRPRETLAPPQVAEFEVVAPRLKSEVAVAGYPYEDRLSAPVVTFGALSEMAGLDGEENLARLSLDALPGDAGGPVLDASGAVLGLLLARGAGGGRVLPKDVAFALDAGAISAWLAQNGVTPVASARSGSMAAEDMARMATRMTVLVSCWD